MLRYAFMFLLGRAVAPLGVLVQMAILARALPEERFADFLEFYSLAVISSAVSDLGERHRFFAAIRNAPDDDSLEPRDRFAMAIVLKLIGTVATMLFLSLPIIDMPLSTRFLAAAFGAIMPVGDIALTFFRGHERPELEVYLAFSEACCSTLGLFILWLGDLLTFQSALLVLLSTGLIRTFVAHVVCRKYVSPDWSMLRNQFFKRLKQELAVAIPTGASVVAVQLFMRAPALTLRTSLADNVYSVFNSFLTLFQRLDLVLSALVQASFKSKFALLNKTFGTFRNAILLSLLGAILLAISFSLVSRFIVPMYLGEQYADVHYYAVFAAVAMLGTYPAFAARLRLQIMGFSRIVIVASVIGGAIQYGGVMLSYSRPEYALIPYFIGTLLFSAIVVAVGLSKELRRG